MTKLGLFIAVIFIVLKVIGVAPFVEWSWLKAFAPIIIGFVLDVSFIVIMVGLHLYDR